MRVWVPGTFTATAASTAPFAATMASGWWTGELEADGVAPTAVTHHGIAPVDKWPSAGQVLHVSVVPSDLSLIKFLWTDEPSREEAGMDAARKLTLEPTQDEKPI